MSRATLALLPGNMCDATLWDGIRADLRAKGWSVADVELVQQDTISAMAQHALSAVDGPIIPVGFSMGGIVAIEIARQASERLGGFVLLDTNPGADLPERAAARPLQQERVRQGELEIILRDELKPVYLAEENRSNASLKAHLLDMAMALGPDVFVRQSEALRTRRDNWDVLPDITVPALVTCGEQDKLCPTDWHRRIANAIPQSELHIVAQSGHMVPLERPDALREMLFGYLARIS